MINLNQVATEVDLGGYILKVKQNIDFKPDNQFKLTIGKIERFKKVHVDPFDNSSHYSIWMYVTEVEKNKSKFWISVSLWQEQYLSGLFTNHIPSTETLIDASTQPEDDDLPF